MQNKKKANVKRKPKPEPEAEAKPEVKAEIITAKKKKPSIFKILTVAAWILLAVYVFMSPMFLFMWGIGNLPSLTQIFLSVLGGIFILVFVSPLKRMLRRALVGTHRKKSMAILAGCVLLLFLVLAYWHANVKRNRLNWIFKRFVTEHVPKNVKLIEGSFAVFQDKVGFLVFETDQGALPQIVRDFTLIPSDKIRINPNSELKEVINASFYYRKPDHERVLLVLDVDTYKAYVDITLDGRIVEEDLHPSIMSSRWTEPTLEAITDFSQEKEEEKYLTPEEVMDEKTDVSLLKAVRINNTPLVEFLVEMGADINREEEGMTALEIAVFNRNYEVAKFLIKKGAKVRSKTLWEAIQSISYKKEIVQLLLNSGADINETVSIYMTRFENLGKEVAIAATPLMIAVFEKNIELVKLLIENGADINFRSKRADAYFPNSIEITALEIAREKNRPEIEKLLLEAGAKQ